MVAPRFVYLLALVAWLGGMATLGAIVAPTLFGQLQVADPENGRALAGLAFGTAIARFHYLAYAAGGAMVLALAAMRILGPKPIFFNARAAIVLLMCAITAYSGLIVLGRIDEIQAAVGILPSRLPVGNPNRVEFDGLHALASRLMQINMVGGLILLFFEAREHA